MHSLANATQYIQPQDKLTIRKYTNGELKLCFDNKELEYTKLVRKPLPASKIKPPPKPRNYDSAAMSKHARANKHKSPWSNYNPNWLKSNSYKKVSNS